MSEGQGQGQGQGQGGGATTVAAAQIAALREKFLSDKLSWTFIILCALVGVAIAAVAGWAVWTSVLKKNPRAQTDVDCTYGDWSPWMGCEAGTPSECGDGVGVRMRGIQSEAMGSGAQCDASLLVEEQLCSVLNSTSCALNACSYSDWSAWSPECPTTTCAANTGNACAPPGMQARFRSIVREAPVNSAAPCDPLSLFEFQACTVTGACTPVDCVPEAWSDVWSGCPTDACVPDGAPAPPLALEYQTRGVAVHASGGGQDCNPNEFVRSRPCPPLPPCSGCTVTEWGPWSACDAPCVPPTNQQGQGQGQGQATQWRVATAVDNPTNTWCNDTQVRACPDWPVCPAGAFATLAGKQGTAALPEPTPLAGSSLPAILALCAETPTCAGVSWNSATKTATLLANVSAASLQADASSTVYAWDETATNCVPPTWPMLDAECVSLCSGGTLSSRGRVYAFDMQPDGTPLLSCPVTLELLETPGVSSCAPSNPGNPSAAWTCSASQNCEYEPWVDAPPWSQCSAPCGAGGGTRTRRRGILQQPTFLGAACEPDQLEWEVPCNVPGGATAWSAAPQMVCVGTPVSPPAGTQFTSLTCPAAVSGDSGFSFASGDTLNSASAAGKDIFYASWNHYTKRDKTDALVSAAAQLGFKDWRYAGLDELVVAQAAGAQWCSTGFVAGSGDSPLSSAWYPMQDSGVPECGPPGVNNYSADSAGGGVFVGTKPTAAQAASLFAPAGIAVLPFYTSLSGSARPDVWSSPPAFPNVCSGHADLDAELAGGVGVAGCAPAASALSFAADFSCAPAHDCSLSDWVDYTSCPACGPPFYKWQTREYVAGPTNGGTPCYAFPTQRSVTCAPAPPACSSLQGATVFGPWPSQQPAGLAPCNGTGGVTGTAFVNSWDVPVQASWILAQNFNSLNTFNGSTQSALPQGLADSLNAQCLGAGGAAPTCIQVGTGASAQLFQLSAGSPGGSNGGSKGSGGSGWTQVAPGACAVDPVAQACLSQRNAGGGNTRLMFDTSAQTWTCPSTCPYNVSACSFSACTAPCAGFSGTQQMERAVLQVGNDYSPPERLWTTPCVGAASLPACSGASCPQAPNTLPCGGPAHGTCDSKAGTCTCVEGFSGPACWYGCPVDAYGRVCSGAGTCNSEGACACNPGFTGVSCEVPPYSVLGMYANARALRACDNSLLNCNNNTDGMPLGGWIVGDTPDSQNVCSAQTPEFCDSCVNYSDAISYSYSLDTTEPVGTWWMQRYMPFLASSTCEQLGFSKLIVDTEGFQRYSH